MPPKKRQPAVIDEAKQLAYKPTIELIEGLYLNQEFKTGPPESADEEDFKLLSTMRYDPLLSTNIDLSSLMELDSDDASLFFLFEEHFHRLNFELMYFQFGFQLKREDLLKNLKQAIASLDKVKPYRIRLTVDRAGKIDIQVMDTAPRPNLLDGFDPLDDASMWNVYIDSEPILISPFTSFKTTRRDHYNVARERSLPKNVGGSRQEVLLFNTAKQLLEGSITNIAVRQVDEETLKESWFTPTLSSGCLCGTVRHMLLSKGLIKEKLLTLSDVQIGDEILLFNGLQGVVRGRIVG